MQMRGRKATAFIIENIILTGIFASILWKVPADKITTVLTPWLIAVFIFAYILVAALFIGGNSLDKFLRIKFPGIGGGENHIG